MPVDSSATAAPVTDTADQSKGAAATKTKATPPAQRTAAILGAAVERITVPFAALLACPLNPRKEFDKEAIATLADSIATEGLIQNLTVRPAPKALANHFEIVAGERRHRAIQKLIEDGRANRDYPVAVSVHQLNDTQVLLLAMAENMGRKDLSPMEEAHGLLRLKKLGVETDDMAASLGVSRRHVQLRLALVEKTTTEIQKAITEGEVNVTQARAITMAPKALQPALLKEIKKADEDEPVSEARLRDMIFEALAPIKSALFDLAQYKGEIVEGDQGQKYFADVPQFLKLQKAELEAQLEPHREAKKKIRIFNEPKGDYFYEHGWKKKADHPKAQVVVVVSRDHSVKIKPGLVSTDDLSTAERRALDGQKPEKKAKGAKPEVADPITKGAWLRGHVRQSHAIQRQLAQRPIDAMRVACMAMLSRPDFQPSDLRCSRDFSMLSKVGACSLDTSVGKSLAKLLEPLKAKTIEVTPDRGLMIEHYEQGWKDGARDKEGEGPAIWKGLCAMKDADVVVLLAHLIATTAGIWSDDAGADGAELALATQLEIVGHEAKHGLTLQVGDLEGLRKPALLGIAATLGTPVGDGWNGKAILKAIKETIAFGRGVTNTFVPPALRFLPAKDAGAEVAALVKLKPKAPTKEYVRIPASVAAKAKKAPAKKAAAKKPTKGKK